MKITTNYAQTGENGKEKTYSVWGDARCQMPDARWLKTSVSTLEDTFVIGNNCTFDDRVTDVGNVTQVFKCNDCGLKTYRVRSVRGSVAQDEDLTLEYGSGVPELHFTQLAAPTCDHCGSRKMEFDEYSAWMRYGIITDESSQICAAYGYKTWGVGGISVGIDMNGTPNLSAAIVGNVVTYAARTVTIHF